MAACGSTARSIRTSKNSHRLSSPTDMGVAKDSRGLGLNPSVYHTGMPARTSNAAASCGLGALVRAGLPALGETARALCLAKLDQSVFSTGVRAFFCGILMYLAVSIFREKGSALGILLCVPAFILSGFEHSIADMFYFGASGIVSLRALGFIWTAIAGNALGGLFLPVLTLLAEKGETHEG